MWLKNSINDIINSIGAGEEHGKPVETEADAGDRSG